MTIIYFILILGIIVLVHELGHFLFAKLFGVYVYEFSIGMGPKIWSRKEKGKETEYSIRALPIGGAVMLAGEEVDDDKKIPKNRKLQSKPVWQRFLIMFFGAGSNFILAILTLFLVAMLWGAPSTEPIISEVTEGYVLYDKGVRAGDEVLSIDGEKTKTIDDTMLYMALAYQKSEITFGVVDKAGKNHKIELRSILSINDNAVKSAYDVMSYLTLNNFTVEFNDGKTKKTLDVTNLVSINGNDIKSVVDISKYIYESEIVFEVRDVNGNVKMIKAMPLFDREMNRYRFGMTFAPEREKGILSSIRYAFVKTGSMIKQMFLTLKLLFTGQLGMNNLGGPVAIFDVVGTSQKQGAESLLMLLVLLCINVGFINLIPFPAFDGGRILFLVIEKIKGSPVKAETENKIHTVGFILLMILIVYVTINDVLRLF